MAGRSVRLFVRTKKRYEPTHFQSQLWYMDVTDFAGCSVGDIKRKCHKETLAKVDDLFYLNQSLADDRLVAHYNFPDGAILETTSNPLWAAMIHVKMVEVERERDSNPHDHHVQRWTHRSYAKKTMLLSVLFNAKKHDNVQPPNFPAYEDFILYLERLGRKGANINPNYSGQDFQQWFAQHLQLDVDKPDPIRAFQARHAARLGLHPVEGEREKQQVRQQVYVLRSETEEDAQRLQRWFSQDQQLPKQGEVKETDRQGEEGKRTAEDRKDGGKEEEKIGCVADNFACSSQADQRMLQEALSLSLISTLEREDPDNTEETSVSPILLPERDSHHLQQSDQLTSQPLLEGLAPLPPHNSPVAKEARHVSERSPSPLGFTEDDAILIDSQGLDDGPAGMEVDECVIQNSGGSGNFSVESHHAETVASMLETEQAVKESVLKEDEALAKRLQAEENLKNPANFTRLKRKTVGSEGEGSMWDQREDRRQEDVNNNRYNCRDINKNDDSCIVDRTAADCVITDLTHSQHRPQQTAAVSNQSLSSPRKRPAQTSAESLSQPVSERKNLKTQLESDEELARRLQWELNSNGGVDQPEDSSLWQKDVPTSCVGMSSRCASSVKNLYPKEEDESIALSLQEEEMLSLSVDSRESAMVSKCCDSDSTLKDDAALARGLQQAENFQCKIPLLSPHTSSQALRDTADIRTTPNSVTDLPDSIKKEASSYIASDEELARRLQKEEERMASKALTSVLSPVLTRRLSGKRGATLEDDERLARQLQKEQEVEMLGFERGDKARRMLGGTVSVKRESHKGTCHTRPSIDLTVQGNRPSDLKRESKANVGMVEHSGRGMDMKRDPHNPAHTSDGHFGIGAYHIKGSVLSGQHHSSAFGDGLAPVPESPPVTVTSKVKCGSCGHKGHNRRFERCPSYYTEKEKKRRDAMEEAHRLRAEERAREAEERQREEQRALERLAVTRNILQHNKEQMMQQIATATQQCANQFQSQLDDIDRLINSKQRKQKTAKAKQKKH